MGFNTVYRFLSEIFPQVDARLLKAVAIEHSKDADAAANAVLTEILPYWTKQSVTSSSLPGDQSAPYSTSNDQNAPISTLKYQSAPNSTSKDQSLRDLSDGDGDADAAANAVLTEILPYWTKQSVTSSSLPGNQSAPYSTSNDQNAPNSTSKDQSAPNSTSKDQSAPNSTSKDQSLRDLSDGDGEHEEISSLSRRRRIVVRKRNKNAGTSPEPGAISSGNVPNSDSTHMHCADSASLSKALDASTNLHFFDANDGSNQLFGNSESEEVILLGKTEESSNEVGSNKVSVVIPNIMMNDVDLTGGCAYTESGESDSLDNGQDFNVKVGPELNTLVMSAPLTHENDVVNGHLTDGKDSDGSLGTDLVKSISGKCQEEESCSECPVVVAENPVAQLVPSSVQELMLDASESDLQSDIVSGTSSTDCKKADASGSLDLKSKKENSISEKGAIEDELTVNTVITRSGQICRIDLLEEIIEDAKNNKRTLFLAMESVMNMMKEVELQEKAAEEAKIEAARGGLDILIKVEELKHMLSHAKAANDMHAGEVYGEKAILATEARELQTRLLSLSEERDKSLAILDEMREVLEGRLAAAEELRKAAEEEKLGKEKSARSYLAELEALMEKVVKESKILQQEAEENSKLREFLMDRGHVVDSLQGEISVICQDVRLLKEKFDERVPLSQSISSSQTTCILASSGSSSVKSLASLHAEQGLSSETALVGASPTPTIDVQSPKSSLGDERSGADRRELLDDGWDFFDKDTELYGRKL